MPISAANRSTARSIAAVASGRPAPRYAEIGVVLVTTTRNAVCTCGMSYGPTAIRLVRTGRKPLIRG